MAFESELPIWQKLGTKPPANILNTEGWGAGKKPPADWFDWLFNRNYLALQELQRNAIHTDQKGTNNGIASLGPDGKLVESQRPPTQTINDGTTTTKGIVQLEDSVTSTSTTKAATPNSVKTAKDTAETVNNALNAHKNDYKAHLLYNATTGTVNTYILTPSLAIASYEAIEGVPVGIKVNVDNTGASTINISGKGAKSILNSKGNPLPAGTLKANSVYTLRYNGTSFILQGEGGGLSDADKGTIVTAINSIFNS